MQQRSFEHLTVLRHEHGGDLCRQPDGSLTLRVSIASRPLQEAMLLQLPESIPAQLRSDRLEMLFPWQEGQSLEEWLFYERPTLGQRKKMCFSLMEQLLTEPIPPTLLALAAVPENLRLNRESARLLLLPPEEEEPQEEPQAIAKAASLMVTVLTQKLEPRIDQREPDALEILRRRNAAGEYTSWDLLQADLFRLPEDLTPRILRLQRLKDRVLRILSRWTPILVRILTGLLALAALTSLVFAGLHWYEERQAEQWPGITEIGEETLKREERELW